VGGYPQALATLSPGNNPNTQRIGGKVSPKDGLEMKRDESLSLPNIQSRGAEFVTR